ncbi:hypothetical protein EDD15DRAFT_1885257 [Pisolithus albus]|nr:hypothetical protein EDD15DRAFT_1885257 [Pisolithus albus]
MVQDIKVLQARLDATKDEDEQRALEEDVTGKVLWLFWCGICAEVDDLIPKVVDYIRRKGSIEGLWKIRVVASVSTDPCDDQAHLQRIMYDAGANTSKHQLWLDARASEQAKWPCTDRGTPTVDNQVLPAQKQKLSESHGATTDVGADDQVANGGTRWLRRQAWYGADGWVSLLVVISYPAVMAFVIRALSVQ